ncbi:hypothetical protein FOZ63_014225, partial [Perkinsus olseni]
EFGCVPAKFPNSLGPLRCILDQACEGSPDGNGQPLDAICEGATPIGRLVRVQMQDGSRWSARPCLVKPADGACGRSLIESGDNVPTLVSLSDEQATDARRTEDAVVRPKVEGLKDYCISTVSGEPDRGYRDTVEVEEGIEARLRRLAPEERDQLGKPQRVEGLPLGVLSEGGHCGMEIEVHGNPRVRSLKHHGPMEPHPKIWCHDRSCWICCRDGGIVYFLERYDPDSPPLSGYYETGVCDSEVDGLKDIRASENADHTPYGDLDLELKDGYE